MAELYNFNFEYADILAFATASSWGGAGSPAISSTYAHGGSKSLYINDGGYVNTYISSPVINTPEIYGSLWIYLINYPPYGDRDVLSGTCEAGPGFEFRINTSGYINMYINYTFIGSTATAISLNTWTNLKFHIRFSDTNSIYEIKIGTETYNSTAYTRGPTGNNIWSCILGEQPSGPTVECYIDDFILDDSQYPSGITGPTIYDIYSVGLNKIVFH